ncbi:MAG: hypothetical protein OEQ39_12580, partial [Gammaproteobacteria bacterium]|nr:hypothetical protein [Gammaproteobacteria bacterium]
QADDCSLNQVINISGHFARCGFPSNFGLGTDAHCVFDSCYSERPGNTAAICNWNGAHHANFRNYSGGLEIQNMVARSPEAIASIDLDPGTLILGPTNTGGQIKVRGVGEYDPTLLGSPSPIVDDSELVRGIDTHTSRKLLQNRTHTDPNTGIMTVFDDNDVDVFMQADLFEGVTTAQPYRGQGSERRDRLT